MMDTTHQMDLSEVTGLEELRQTVMAVSQTTANSAQDIKELLNLVKTKLEVPVQTMGPDFLSGMANEINELLNTAKVVQQQTNSLSPLLDAIGRAHAIRSGAYAADATQADPASLTPNAERPQAESQSLQDYESLLNELDPKLYPTWCQLFQNGAEEYHDDPDASCSKEGNAYSDLFRCYLKIYARGFLLDIGCGTEGTPGYLSHYPPNLLFGLDPREAAGEENFEYIQGFNEFLPWSNDAFDTIVSGTSLDHVLSLNKSLEEVQRVLKPEGLYLVWLASIPGAQPFEPHREDYEAVDEYHLFHFDRSWIEPILTSTSRSLISASFHNLAMTMCSMR